MSDQEPLSKMDAIAKHVLGIVLVGILAGVLIGVGKLLWQTVLAP